MTFSTTYDSPIGRLLISCDETHVLEISDARYDTCANDQHPILQKTTQELSEYFSGKRTDFDIPVKPRGTDFQKKVWEELVRIPFGKTASYKEIAQRIGNENASRAVGNACNKNNIIILIPCHRVVGSNGTLTGFALGLHVKEKLLSIERIV